MTPEKNDATVMLRLPSDLKAALQREALRNGRRITAEINMRLSASLEQVLVLSNTFGRAVGAQEPLPSYEVDKLEQRVLELYRRLSPSKQSALLELLK